MDPPTQGKERTAQSDYEATQTEAIPEPAQTETARVSTPPHIATNDGRTTPKLTRKASALPVAATTEETPLPAVLFVAPANPSAPEAETSPAHAPPLVSDAPGTPVPKLTVVPQAENLAFAVRMQEQTSAPESLELKPPATSEVVVPRPEPQPSAHEISDSPRLASQVATHWSDAAVWQTPEANTTPAKPELLDINHPNVPLTVQEAHVLAPEPPKTSASSEILLHLTGNDQATAAIRVADRAGSVSVSVHASDPALRDSLRSNLGELSTQLSAQGWKADVFKSAAAAHAGSQSDSRSGEHRSFDQQQSRGSDREPQRERRANGGQWQQELDQQVSGDAHPGGNG